MNTADSETVSLVDEGDTKIHNEDYRKIGVFHLAAVRTTVLSCPCSMKCLRN